MDAAFDLDLDSVARPDLRVRFGGRIWKLPGGPQSEVVVNLAALFENFDKHLSAGETDRLKAVSDEIRDALLDLFAERHSEEELADLPRLDDEQMAAIFTLLIGQIRKAREERAERPTRPTSTPKPKSAARSRARSRTANAAATGSTS